MSEINYCRRECGDDARLCMGKITTPNALNWCEACRARLPYWPVDSAPVAHVGRGIAEAFGLDKLPASLVVIHDDPIRNDAEDMKRGGLPDLDHCAQCGDSEAAPCEDCKIDAGISPDVAPPIFAEQAELFL